MMTHGHPWYRKINTAFVAGDQTGNTRGAQAFDIQSTRSSVTRVASGALAASFGSGNTTSGASATTVGRNNTASGDYSSAFGYANAATGAQSNAVGRTNTASGALSSAFGFNSVASGSSSFALGFTSTASNSNSSAIGSSNSASGINSAAVGSNNIASGLHSNAFGRFNTASFYGATAVGYLNTASNSNSSVFGYVSAASGVSSTAVGFKAVARITNTTNICGPQIIRKDNAEGLSIAFQSFCGVKVVLTWTEVDLKTAADFVISLPAGCHFYPDEVGVIVTSATAVTVQPTVRFGNTGTPAKLLAATITTTAVVQFDRQRFQTLLSSAGEVTLSAGITTGATATTMLGRFYMVGLLVEDE